MGHCHRRARRGHGHGPGGGDGAGGEGEGQRRFPLPAGGAGRLRSLPALRVLSPGNARCPRPGPARPGPARRLRHGPAQPGRAPALPGADLVPRLRAAASSPPIPHRQPELRQQGPHGARAAELLPHPPAHVFGSSGQVRHVQERKPEHVAGEEPLHRHRHLHHGLRAPGLPPQLQPQRALALQGPAAVDSFCPPRS